MKFNKIFPAALLVFGSLCATAQEKTVEQEITVDTFQPHWYVLGQVGLQETLGETTFGRLASVNAQIGVGYNFTSAFGARLTFNGWTSKGGLDYVNEAGAMTNFKWKWNYVAPTVAVTADLVDLIGGFNPHRVVSAGVFAGVGANVAFDNDEAIKANEQIKNLAFASMAADKRPNALRNLWDGSKVRFVGQFGVFADFKVAERVKVGIELQANVLPDGFNSKKAPNADWYFNGLVGVKYSFGSGYKKTTRKVQVPVVTEYVEKIVEVPVVKEVIKEVGPTIMTRDIFFKISKHKINKDQMLKVAEIAAFLKDHPNARVKVTGYADKGTGTRSFNIRLAAKRAQAVADALVDTFGVDRSRIETSSMGKDEYQPYSIEPLNRVSICVAGE